MQALTKKIKMEKEKQLDKDLKKAEEKKDRALDKEPNVFKQIKIGLDYRKDQGLAVLKDKTKSTAKKFKSKTKKQRGNVDEVDREKVVIFGNSAGGLTALNCLLYGSIFTAAICKYPVIDLKDMHYNTHRFEKDYLNSLVGNYAKNYDDYINRSPINHINKIKKPILMFHGKKDTVISYKQTLKIQEILIQNNKYSEVIFFDNEGHGFRNIENKEVVMQKSQEFLKNALNI